MTTNNFQKRGSDCRKSMLHFFEFKRESSVGKHVGRSDNGNCINTNRFSRKKLDVVNVDFQVAKTLPTRCYMIFKC